MQTWMTYRGSLLTRIAGTVVIAFIWLGFLVVYLALNPPYDPETELAVLLVSGLTDAAAIGGLWLVWFLGDRKAFRTPPSRGVT